MANKSLINLPKLTSSRAKLTKVTSFWLCWFIIIIIEDIKSWSKSINGRKYAIFSIDMSDEMKKYIHIF